MNKLIPKKSSKLKTPQSLIHINHNMTILQYKYWIIFLHHIKKQIMDGVEADKNGYQYISFDEISKFLGYTPKKSEVYADLKRLRSYSVEYNVLEKDGEKAKVIDGFLYSASVSSKRVGYVLPPVFIQAMLDVDEKSNIFQLLNWEIFNSFSGKYEAIIYKLCKDYEGVKRTPYMTVDEFREYLGLKDEEYSQFKALNRSCISNPVKKINESLISDISIKVMFEKEGRSIKGLYFGIESKQMSLPFDDLPQTKAFDFAKVSIPLVEQKKYLETMEEVEIIATIERANEYAETLTKQEKKANLGAIYKKAFSDRWGVQYLENKILKDKELEEKKAKQLQIKQIEKAEKDKMEKEQEASEEAVNKFKALSEIEQEKILDKIEEKLQETPFFVKDFNKKREEGKEFISLPPYVFELKRFL